MQLDLNSADAVLLDLDGTVYHDNDPLPGAAELIARLQARGRTFACLSNSTGSPAFVLNRLAGFGVHLNPELVYTAAVATCDYVRDLARQWPRRLRVYNLSSGSAEELLGDAVDWLEDADVAHAVRDSNAAKNSHAAEDSSNSSDAADFNRQTDFTDSTAACDVVIVGAPTASHATEARRRTALALLRRATARQPGGRAAPPRLIGMCADRVFPSPRGIEFGAGALTEMLAYAAGVVPTYIGKPEAVFFRELCRRLGVDPTRCVLVGDNPESDIAGARGVGMKTILTLTGIVTPADLATLPPEGRGDEVIDDLRALIDRV